MGPLLAITLAATTLALVTKDMPSPESTRASKAVLYFERTISIDEEVHQIFQKGVRKELRDELNHSLELIAYKPTHDFETCPFDGLLGLAGPRHLGVWAPDAG